MADGFILAIDNVVQTQLVSPGSVVFDMNLQAKFGQTLSFTVRNPSSSYKVEGGSRVDFYFPKLGNRYFTGFVTETTPGRYSAGAWEYDVKAFSAEQIFYRKNIHSNIRNQTVEASINQILSDPSFGFPSNLRTTVLDTHSRLQTVINAYAINGAFAYQVWDLFAELTNTVWRVLWNSTQGKFILEFFDPSINYSSLQLNQTSGNFRWNRFKPTFNLQKVVNRQRVLGGKTISGSDTVVYFRGDGLSSRFDLPVTPYVDQAALLLYDDFSSGTFNPSIWTEEDPNNYVYVSTDRVAQFEPDPGNLFWCGIQSNVLANRAKPSSSTFDISWVSNGEAIMGYTSSVSVVGYTSLIHGFYVDGSGLLWTVQDGVKTTTGITLTSLTQYRFRLRLVTTGGAVFEYQSGANVYTRNWTILATTTANTSTGLNTVIYTLTGGFSLTVVKTRNPFLGVTLQVDRGNGFQNELVGAYPADQDLDAVIVDDKVLSFFGSDPGPSTIPPTPDFIRAVTVNTSTDVLTVSGGHKLQTGDQIQFATTGTAPGGINVSQPYYLRDINGSNFKIYSNLADSLSGTSPIDITSSGSGTLNMIPGKDYKNIRVTFREAQHIVVQYQDNDSIADIAALFGSGDDGIRDGAVINDASIAFYEVAFAKARNEVENGRNVVDTIVAETDWLLLYENGITTPPRPGDTLNFNILIPTTNYPIYGAYPIQKLTMRSKPNGMDFSIRIEAGFYKKGLLAVFNQLTASGELISLSESQNVNQFVTAEDSLASSDAQQTFKNYTKKWGASAFNRTVTANVSTNIFTTSSAHPFTTADPVYIRTTGSPTAPVTSGGTYYVSVLSSTTFYLYDTAANATAGGATGRVDVSSTGSGTHTVVFGGWRWNLHNWGSYI